MANPGPEFKASVSHPGLSPLHNAHVFYSPPPLLLHTEICRNGGWGWGETEEWREGDSQGGREPP